MTLLPDIPNELLLSIAAYGVDVFSIGKTVRSIRFINRRFYSFTQSHLYWDTLHQVHQQAKYRYNLHTWLDGLIYRTIHGTFQRLLDDEKDTSEFFNCVVNNWVDLYALSKGTPTLCQHALEDAEVKDENLFLKYLLTISFSCETMQYLGTKRMAPAIQHFFHQLFRPGMEIVKEGQKRNDLLPSNIMNDVLLDLMREDDWNDIVTHWKLMDGYCYLLPRQYFIFVVCHFSNTNLLDENNQVTDAALWIMKTLYNMSIDVVNMIFITSGKFKNCDRDDNTWIPETSLVFTLQFLALWINNERLLRWALTVDTEGAIVDEILKMIQDKNPEYMNIIKQTEDAKDFTKVSTYSRLCKGDAHGYTLLHYAVSNQNETMVEMLLNEFVASPFMPSRNFKTPIQIAKLKSEKIFNMIADKYRKILDNPGYYLEEPVYEYSDTESQDGKHYKDEIEKYQIPIRENFVMEEVGGEYTEDDFQFESSDESSDEEFISGQYLREITRLCNEKEDSNYFDPYFKDQDMEEECFSHYKNIISTNEFVETKFDEYAQYPSSIRVAIGERRQLNEKKRPHGDLEENATKRLKVKSKPFIDRSSNSITKRPFSLLANQIAEDYNTVMFTPNAMALLHEAAENELAQTFKLANMSAISQDTDSIDSFNYSSNLFFSSCMYDYRKFMYVNTEGVYKHIKNLSNEELSSDTLSKIGSIIHSEVINDDMIELSDDDSYPSEDDEDEQYFSDNDSDVTCVGLDISSNHCTEFVHSTSIDDLLDKEETIVRRELEDGREVFVQPVDHHNYYAYVYTRDKELMKDWLTDSTADMELQRIVFDLFH